jgi:hypothetical protein
MLNAHGRNIFDILVAFLSFFSLSCIIAEFAATLVSKHISVSSDVLLTFSLGVNMLLKKM